MPEGPEVTILSQYLLTKLKGRLVEKLEVLSGKYSHKKPLENKDLLNGENKFKIQNVESHGKLMWMTMKNTKNNDKLYLISHLGLTGEWGFSKGNNDRIKITIGNIDNKKKYNLYYADDRNFGNIYIVDDIDDVRKKKDLLAPDALKTGMTLNEFSNIIKKYISKSKTRKNQLIFRVLMNQTIKDGIVSGLGNYLTPEILYRAKISPFRKMDSLTEEDITELFKSMKYIIKLSYYNNTTGYMTNFGQFIKIHKEKINSGKYPVYHQDIKLKEKEFVFSVYRKNNDPLGNAVEKDKTINKNRTVYWVPAVQK
jgi:formamidopyrimidine-DNA glycosylase